MDTDDPAKDRAEARAEKELQLKIETLELERDKFRYTQRQSKRDRMSAAGARGAGALMFAHGSMIVVSLTNYRTLSDLLKPEALHRELTLVGIGLYLAAVGFVSVLAIGTVASFEPNRMIRPVWLIGITSLFASFCLFGLILENAIRALGGIGAAP